MTNFERFTFLSTFLYHNFKRFKNEVLYYERLVDGVKGHKTKTSSEILSF